MHAVYADLFFLLQFTIDYLLLYAAGSLAARRGDWWRMVLAAGLGALYGVGIMEPALAAWYHPAAVALFPVAMVALAYLPVSVGDFLRLTGYFYLGAVLVAGAALGLTSLLALEPGTLGGLLLLAGVLLGVLWAAERLARRWRRGWAAVPSGVELRVAMGDRRLQVPALVDTGNRLQDPLTGAPVAVMGLQLLERLAGGSLPSEPTPLARALHRLPDFTGRVRLIPFRSLGRREGLMVVFRPQALTAVTDGTHYTLPGMLVGVTADELGPADDHQALVPPIDLAARAGAKDAARADDVLAEKVKERSVGAVRADAGIPWFKELRLTVGRLLHRLGLRSRRVDYIGGSQTLPPPLERDEEKALIQDLATGKTDVRATLIERNLRLVVYIARKFENTGIPIEDLVSIGSIGLIKAVNTFDPERRIKLATYASKCIENEILMHLRRNNRRRMEISFDEPLNVDWDGNELLLSDVYGTDADMIYEDIEASVDRELVWEALQTLEGRERRIMELRFGLNDGIERTQKEVADNLGISQSYISRLEKRILNKLRGQLQTAP